MSPCHAGTPPNPDAVIVSPLFCVLPHMDSLNGHRITWKLKAAWVLLHLLSPLFSAVSAHRDPP